MIVNQILSFPTDLSIESDTAITRLTATKQQSWQVQDMVLELDAVDAQVYIYLSAPRTAVKRVFIRWQFSIASGGVQPVLDVRCGGKGVQLGERCLLAATVILREAEVGQSPFMAAQALCAKLCPRPRLPDHPVYGSNDWYYDYGNNTRHNILRDGQITAELQPNPDNRPHVVIDAGWQTGEERIASCDRSDHTADNNRFPDMPGLASALKALGVRPGIWVRPFIAPSGTPASHCLTSPEKAIYTYIPMLDPSLPENLAILAEDIRRLKDWGYI